MDDNELQREKIPDADDYKWDLETFHQAVFAAEKALTKPPFKASIVTFPASLLDDLTDDHVELLFKWVGMPEQEKYSYWRKVYAFINERFSCVSRCIHQITFGIWRCFCKRSTGTGSPFDFGLDYERVRPCERRSLSGSSGACREPDFAAKKCTKCVPLSCRRRHKKCNPRKIRRLHFSKAGSGGGT